jgi:UDP-glucose:(heptosyl)LPS alpha-1,3-glucosyltransferase
LEALASGLPVITTSATGASEIVTQRKDGWIIGDMRDENELKMAIRYFYEEDVRSRVYRLGREKAEAYSEKSNFDLVIRIFKGVSKDKS